MNRNAEQAVSTAIEAAIREANTLLGQRSTCTLFFGADAALERNGPVVRDLFRAEYAAVDEKCLLNIVEQ
jgi:hypothetical protein